MSDKEELKEKLRKKSAESAAKADILLEKEFNSLMKVTRTDLELLRPKIKDQATYDKLISIVEEATQSNMDLATLKERLETLGKKGIQIVKEIAGLLKF